MRVASILCVVPLTLILIACAGTATTQSTAPSGTSPREIVKAEPPQAPVDKPAPGTDKAAADIAKAAREEAKRKTEAEAAERKRKVEMEAEKQRQALAEQERIDRLWRLHGRNFVYVGGEFVRLPDMPETVTKIQFRVIQVVDDEHMLVSELWRFDLVRWLDKGTVMLVTSTKGCIDDKTYTNDGQFLDVGTYSYVSTIGARRTVRKIIAYDGITLTREQFVRLLASGVTDLGPAHLAEEQSRLKTEKDGLEADERRRRERKQAREKQAGDYLNNAKRLVDEGEDEEAIAYLKTIVSDLTDTAVAKDASKLLSEMNKPQTREEAKKHAEEQARRRVEAKKRRDAQAAKEKAERDAKEKAVQEAEKRRTEEAATRKLKLAKSLLNDAKEAHRQGDRQEEDRLREAAIGALQGIIDKLPGTPAADEAKKLLDSL